MLTRHVSISILENMANKKLSDLIILQFEERL